MKKIILILFLSLSASGFSQTYPYKQWQQSYKPQQTNWGAAVNDSKLDNQGNLIEMGVLDSISGINSYPKGSFVTKFKKHGGIEWTSLNSGYYTSFNSLRLFAMDIDNQNNIYVAGRSDSSSFYGKKASLIKYSSSGTVLWEKHFGVDPYYKECSFTDVTIDAQGNIIAAGYAVSTINGSDTSKLFIAKFNPNGTLLWTKLHLQQRLVYGNVKIAADNSFNIFAFYEGRTFNDQRVVMITKFNSSGTTQWQSYYQGDNPSRDDYIYDLKIGPDNNPVLLYILNNASPSYSTVCLAKLSTSTGEQLINANFGVSFSSYDELPGNVVFSSSGDIYFCYSSRTDDNTNYEGFLCKLSPTGTMLWTRNFNSLYQSGDYLTNIAIDPDDNIYALAYSTSLIKNYLIKYDNSGNKKWEQSFQANSTYYYYSGVHIGSNKEAYLAYSSSTIDGYSTSAYKFIQVPGELTQSVKTVNKPITDFQDVYDTLNISGIPSSAVILRMEVKLDSIKHTYPHDMTIHLTSPNGYTDSIVNHAGPFMAGTGFFSTALSDTAVKIIDSASSPFRGYFRPSRPLSSYNFLRASGNWVVRIRDNAEGDNGTLYKWGLVITYYDSLLTEIRTITTSNTPDNFHLSQNYPNPFNPVTNINFDLSKDAKIQLSVFDISGRLIQEIISNENFAAGYHTVQFNGSALASGIYFYRLMSENFIQTKKMILIK